MNKTTVFNAVDKPTNKEKEEIIDFLFEHPPKKQILRASE